MNLIDFPNEILEMIVRRALPDDFENLALSCKHIHAICTPYIEHHNDLRWHFRDFRYGKTDQIVQSQMNVIKFPNSVTSSFNLIARIASEPMVAEYIQTADFSRDARIGEGITSEFTTNPCFNEQSVKDLLARSSYLKEAGLDWKEYYTAMAKNHAVGRYSQHAAVFVLTLLPNLRDLGLPAWWMPLFAAAAPGKLLEVVIQRARTADRAGHRPSLARVTAVRGDLALSPGLDVVLPFLALPGIQLLHYFNYGSISGFGGQNDNTATTFASGVQEIILYGALINEVDLASLLKHTPHLKRLKYWTSSRDPANANADAMANWNPGRSITTIADQVGHTPEALAIDIGNTPPGKLLSSSMLSINVFQKLKRFEIPLQTAVCCLMAGGPEGRKPWALTDLVPASISKLSLVARGTDMEARALRTLFRDFAASVHPKLPDLRGIYLKSPKQHASELYAEQYDYLVAEADKAGVVVKEREYFDLTDVEDEEQVCYELESEEGV